MLKPEGWQQCRSIEVGRTEGGLARIAYSLHVNYKLMMHEKRVCQLNR